MKVACTIGNSAGRGGGIYMTGSSLNIMNSHLFLDDPQEIYFQGTGTESSVTISFSDVENGLSGIETNDNGTAVWGEGNRTDIPLYAEGCGCVMWEGDPGGELCTIAQRSVYDESPGWDDGNPASQYNELDGSRNNMGWFGGPNGCCAPD